MGRNCWEKVAIFLVFTTVICAQVKESMSQLAPLTTGRHQRGIVDPDIVNRVARVPSIRTPDTVDFSNLRLGSLKSPGYQMRYRPLRPLNHVSEEEDERGSDNSQGTTEATKRAGADLKTSDDDDTDSYDMLDSESPTFTPYIGAHALSNMEKFFEHLRENLEAIQTDGTGEIDQPERRRMTSGENNNPPPPSPLSSERTHPHEQMNSSPEARLPPAMALQVQPQPWVTYRERSSYLPSSGGGSSTGGGGRLRKMQAFFQPLTEEESYLRKANNYNPSWLWTNLGLGKKRRR